MNKRRERERERERKRERNEERESLLTNLPLPEKETCGANDSSTLLLRMNLSIAVFLLVFLLVTPKAGQTQMEFRAPLLDISFDCVKHAIPFQLVKVSALYVTPSVQVRGLPSKIQSPPPPPIPLNTHTHTPYYRLVQRRKEGEGEGVFKLRIIALEQQ